MAFAPGLRGSLVAYDRKTDAGPLRQSKLDDFRRFGVDGSCSNKEATNGATLILSLVTADQALAAARETARSIRPDALFCDMNSVAPQTKRAAAAAIEDAGGRYVDVAVMSPVQPGGTAAPLLVAGAHTGAATDALRDIGFTKVEAVAGPVGTASAVKLVRSIMVKGIEALSAECAMAAAQAGVLETVVASLDSSWPGAEWLQRFDYNLDRMMVHGERRAAEMREAAAMLDTMGITPAMTLGTVALQQAIGTRRLTPPPGLAAKLAALTSHSSRSEAA